MFTTRLLKHTILYTKKDPLVGPRGIPFVYFLWGYTIGIRKKATLRYGIGSWAFKGP